MAVDPSGNVYVADTGNETIRKVTLPAPSCPPWRARPASYGSLDGTGTSAEFYGPASIAVDSATNLYVADYFNHTIRKITSAAVVTTLAGSVGSYGFADAAGASARFFGPLGVAGGGTNVYVADTGNGTIRRITSAGVVSTLAGSASTGSADGTGGNARFYWPAGVALDSAANLYVADTENGTIRKATRRSGSSAPSPAPPGTMAAPTPRAAAPDSTARNPWPPTPPAISTWPTRPTTRFARSPRQGWSLPWPGLPGTNGITNGTGSSARFNWPAGVAVDGA